MKNEEIIQIQIQKGNAAAFEELFRLYHKELCNYIYRIVLDSDDAKEIAQQVFINLWEKHTDIGSIQSIKSYLFRSAYNTCLNRFKHEKIKSRYVSEERYYLQSTFLAEFENTYDTDLTKKIQDAVEELPRKNQEVFKLRFFKGFDTKQVSEELGITPRTVETHVSNSLKILRANLSHVFQIYVCLQISWSTVYHFLTQNLPL